MTEFYEKVRGYCPNGCGETLFLGEDGCVTCSRRACPNPAVVDQILNDAETEHVVEFTDTGFTIQHPLRERIDGYMFTCPLHTYCTALDGPPVKPGYYIATPKGEKWLFTETSSP